MSHVEAWTSTFLSSGNRDVSPPVELRWGIWDFLELQQGRWTSHRVVRGNLGFHSSRCRGIRPYLGSRGEFSVLSTCGGKHRIPFELEWGSGNTSQIATGESRLLSS